MKKIFSVLTITILISVSCKDASTRVKFISDEAKQSVEVFVNDIYFTSFIYPDNMEKQVLYPIQTPSGKLITRGFPLNPRPFERTDHPHHIGLWFNFGDLNGLDFWNNSYSIKPENKDKYGSIVFEKIVEANDKKGRLIVLSNWVDNKKNILLSEETTYVFGGLKNDIRTIERISELTAKQKVTFTENKEGLLGLRVDRAFEEPTKKAETFLDASGNVTETPVLNNDGVNGVYRNAEGLTGGDVWGKRSKWVALKANKEGETITIVIMDNKNNVNYPAWSHARGYGLFATNNLAGQAVDKNSEPVKLELNPGEKVTFKHKVIIGGNITDNEINEFSYNFNKR
ncbi:MAG: PmoA family protein [Fermentimonas sp.]